MLLLMLMTTRTILILMMMMMMMMSEDALVLKQTLLLLCSWNGNALFWSLLAKSVRPGTNAYVDRRAEAREARWRSGGDYPSHNHGSEIWVPPITATEPFTSKLFSLNHDYGRKSTLLLKTQLLHCLFTLLKTQGPYCLLVNEFWDAFCWGRDH